MVPYRPPHLAHYEQPLPSPGLAAVLSLLFVGAGQWYNGEIGKGLGMLFGTLFLWLFLLGWVINIWSIIDAYNVASERRLLMEQQ
jgi:TM2 domain-containing membrane protein YozV